MGWLLDGSETLFNLLITHFILVERTGSTSNIQALIGYGGSDTLISPSLNLDRTDGKKVIWLIYIQM